MEGERAAARERGRGRRYLLPFINPGTKHLAKADEEGPVPKAESTPHRRTEAKQGLGKAEEKKMPGAHRTIIASVPYLEEQEDEM